MFSRLSEWICSLLAGIIPLKTNATNACEIDLVSFQAKNNENKKIGNFFVLGDSLSDPGNLVAVIKQAASSTLNSYVSPKFLKTICKPYETNVLAKQYFENRFTSSFVFTEIVADKLNIESKCAWNCSNFISTNFSSWWFRILSSCFISQNRAYGNNYALANAKAADNNKLYQSSVKKIKNQIWKTIFFKASYEQFSNLSEQFEAVINNFLSLKTQTDALIKQHQIKENDLIFICIGSNDILDIVDISDNKQVDKAIDEAIDGLKSSIEKLILNQAKRIIVSNIVDLGKIPARLNYFSTAYSQACLVYNEKWEKMIDDLQAKYLTTRIEKFNLYKLFNHHLKIYKQQGKNITGSFVSYEEHDFFMMLKEEKVEDCYKLDECQQENYFFFDKIHPTGKVHQIIAEKLLRIINDN